MKKIILIILPIMVIGCSMHNDTIPVYLCFGQSNARDGWAEGIREELQIEEPEAIIIHERHPGASLLSWFTDEPQDFYYSDLEIIFNELDGINYEVKALFWFQGESDQDELSYSVYEQKFINYVNQLKNDLSSQDIKVILHYVYSPINNLSGIRNVQMNIVNKYDYIYGLETSGYPRLDAYHMWNASYPIVGKEAAELYRGNY